MICIKCEEKKRTVMSAIRMEVKDSKFVFELVCNIYILHLYINI